MIPIDFYASIMSSFGIIRRLEINHRIWTKELCDIRTGIKWLDLDFTWHR